MTNRTSRAESVRCAPAKYNKSIDPEGALEMRRPQRGETAAILRTRAGQHKSFLHQS